MKYVIERGHSAHYYNIVFSSDWIHSLIHFTSLFVGPLKLFVNIRDNILFIFTLYFVSIKMCVEVFHIQKVHIYIVLIILIKSKILSWPISMEICNLILPSVFFRTGQVAVMECIDAKQTEILWKPVRVPSLSPSPKVKPYDPIFYTEPA